MVTAALALVSRGGERPDYGDTDLADIFKQIDKDPGWSPAEGLSSLMALAKKRGAYHADGMAEPGDIVLFHNQRDANENGENDDWLTGAGIVVGAHQSRFEAVIRTGNAPRRISAWVDQPSLRTFRGEIANSFIRVPQRTDPPDTAYLAGQLYAGHIDIEKLLSR